MGKAPAFQFYPNDWARDLEEHPLYIEGAWIRICCKLWWSDSRGKLTRTLDQWAKILRTEVKDTEAMFEYISIWKIGDISYNGNGEVTVISRRMLRDEIDRNNNALRQQRFKAKHRSNDPVTPSVTARSQRSSSSSSSSSPIQKKIYKRKVLSDEEWKTELLKLNSWIIWDDLNREMDTWLLNNPGRQKTRKFISNWILRKQKDKPMPFKKPDLLSSQPSTQAPDWIKDALKSGWKG